MWLIDRRYLASFDWISFFIVLMLSAIGLAFIFSATYTPEVPFSLYFKKQLFGIITGIAIYIGFCSFEYHTLERNGYFLYFATLALLIFTILKGSIGMGAQRWINLGITKFQPAELTKLFLPSFISYYLFTEDKEHLQLRDYAPLLGILVLSFLLVAKQPDLGTALIILFSGGVLLWVAGLSKKFFLGVLVACTVCAPLMWKAMNPYQRNRIMVFLGAGESKKERYHIEQSRIAIGSGGIIGKGFLNSTQNSFMFLPASRTDFIFAIVCEEWGFVGASILLGLYIILFLRLFLIIGTIKNFFAQLLSLGLIIHIVVATLINLCMVMGLMPVVGIPLPFMSYGVTHLWICFASLGWFNGIAMRRFYLSLSTVAH